MKRTISKYKSYIITALITIILIVIFMMVKNIYPFGKNILFLTSDDYSNQYIGYFTILSNMITSMKMSFFNFNLGIGMPILNVIATHVSSPINMIIYLLIKDKLLASNIMMSIKPVLIALTTLYYLNYKHGDKWSNIIFSLLYAFSAFLIVNIVEVMWIDQLIYLPLLTMGIEELITKKDNRMYIISLLLIMITNYYTAYMLCTYSLLYFVIYLFIYCKDNKKKVVLDFIKSSLLCALLCSFLYLPLLNMLKNTNLLNQNYEILHVGFNIFDFICAHFNGFRASYYIEDTIAPNIFCGVVSLVLLIIFIFNKKVDKKEKKLLLIMLSLFYFFLRISELDFVMHFFHYPNGIFYRYSFIYSFILILIGASSINKIKDLDHEDFIKSVVVMGILLIIIGIIMPTKLTINVLLINIGIIIIYFVIFKLFKNIKLMKYIFSIICIIEIFTYMMLSLQVGDSSFFTSRDTGITDYIKSTDNSIYRIQKFNDYYTIGTVLDDYYGIENYNSLINSNVTNMFINLGMLNNNIDGYIYFMNNPVINTMFGIKYAYNVSDRDPIYFDKLTSDIYVNKYFKSLAYTTDSDLLKLDINQDNPMDIFNDYVYLSTKVDKVFEEVKYDSNIINFNGAETIYIHLNDNVDKIIINGYTYTNKKDKNTCLYYEDDLTNINTDYITFEKGNSYKVQFSYIDDTKEKVKFYKLNNIKFQEFYNKLGEVSIEKFTSDSIKLSSNNDKDTLIYTSIPYEDGWKVLVDGKEVNKDKVMNALLAIKVEKGNHTIDIKYEEPYYNVGVYITCTILVLLSINSIKVIVKEEYEEVSE